MPGPDKLFPLLDFSDDYLDWGRSEWGGSGNYLWAVTDDLTWVKSNHTWKFGFIVQQDHYDGYGWHTAAGTYNFNRGATAGFLPNGNARHDRRDRQRVRELPARRSAVVGDHDQSLRLGSVALLLRYAQDDWRVSNKLTFNYGVRYEYTPPTFEGYYPGRLLELQPEPAESRRPTAASARRSSPARAPAAPARRRCTRRGRGASARGSASSTA